MSDGDEQTQFDRNPIDPDQPYGGTSPLDTTTDVDPKAESEEWERRYGSEESRNKLGFDGEDPATTAR